jgi:enamine deaminase RidA (YjgF/YER057c/UK114 family)
MTHGVIQPDGWKSAMGYSHGLSASGRIITLAGQIGWNPKTCEFESDNFAQQTAQALRNVVTLLAAAGGNGGEGTGAKPEHLVRLTWFITDRDEYLRTTKEVGAAYREIIGRHFPAMSVVVVSGLIEARALVEIEATAVVPLP